MTALIRLLSPRLAERWRIWRETRRVQENAFMDARGVCEIFGPAAVAAEYGASPAASPDEIAEAYARACYRVGARSAAVRGALAGFRAYGAANGTVDAP